MPALVDALDFKDRGTRDTSIDMVSDGAFWTFDVKVEALGNESLGQLLGFVLQRLTSHGVSWELVP